MHAKLKLRSYQFVIQIEHKCIDTRCPWNENIIFRPHDAKNINQMLDNKIKTAGLLEIVLKKHINQIFYAFAIYNESIFWWYKNI